MGPNLKALIGKLEHSGASAMEGAAGFCLSRTHYDIEIEHYLMKLLDSTDDDFAKHRKAFWSRSPLDLRRILTAASTN